MLDELLKSTGIPADGAEKSASTCPGKIFFLQREFLEKYWTMAALPPDKLEMTAAFAAELEKMADVRVLAWHLYRYCLFTPIEEFRFQDFPEPLLDLGEQNTGLFYLLVCMSLLPVYRERAEREGFPVRYAEMAAERLGTSVCFHEQAHNGLFGLRPAQMIFMLHYRETATYRIGRFDFVIRTGLGQLPEIYRKNGEIVAFCNDNTPLAADGDVANEDNPAVRTARLVKDGTRICGTPVDRISGKALADEITIDLADGWETIHQQGDWTLFFHIPGGGGMTPEKCDASFREAFAFFRKFCPEKHFRVVWSSSWIFNPAWTEYLPDGNLSKLIRRGELFPNIYHGQPGLHFVFGRECASPADYTAKNSMERAMLQCWQDKGKLRSCGWFMLMDDFC